MTQTIKVLDENTACRIAAGEVVERPVSVVKELVENSLDAGADAITVTLTGGGVDMITVVDNGCGMSQEDTPLAFQRHATSKISAADDLENIKTLGFRGEALPSIAAVSDLIIKTRTPDNDEGYAMHIRGGGIVEFGPVGCPVGTSITITDLFYNTPARRKHLKTKSTEGGLINDLVYKLALVRSGVRFTLEQQGRREVFRSPGTGKLLDTVASVYGVETAGKMVPVNGAEGGIVIDGFVGKPELNRSTRQQITVAVNGRLVRSSTVNLALDEAYKGLIAANRYPLVVLFLTIPPGMIDVNIHPAKTIIKIENEHQLARLISTTVRRALKTVNLIPAADFNVNNKPSLPAATEPFKLSFHESASYDLGYSFVRYVSPTPKGHSHNTSDNTHHIDEYNDSQVVRNNIGWSMETNNNVAYGNTGEKDTNDPVGMENRSHLEVTVLDDCRNKPVTAAEQRVNKSKRFPDLQVVGQVLNMYILCQAENNVYLIDQHAAHERILFEKYYAQLLNNNSQVQYLLAPLSLNLRTHEKELLKEYKRELEALGFVLEDFGRDSLLLRGIPNDCNPGKSERLIADVVETILEQGKTGIGEAEFALSALLACKAAVKAGENLTLPAMQSLVEQLAAADEPFTCPHGRPTLVSISRRELNVMFKRA